MNQRWSNQSTSEMLRLWVCLQSEGKCQNTHKVKTYRHWRIYLSRLWKTCSNKECFESRQRNHPQHPLYQNSLTPRTIKHQQRMGKLCINAQIVNIWGYYSKSCWITSHVNLICLSSLGSPLSHQNCSQS